MGHEITPPYVCLRALISHIMDPTPDECLKMLTLADVVTFIGLESGHMGDDKTMVGSLAQLIGAKADTKPAAVGIIPEPDFDAVLMGWKVPTVSGTGAPGVRPPTLIELGQAKLLGHVCRVVVGKGETVADLKKKATASAAAAAAAASVASSVAAARKVKLSSVISQIDDTEVLLTDEKEILKAYARFEAVYGKGERPPKESEPTAEQITAIKHLLDQGACPYADFAIFGPFGMRILKKVKLSGVVIGRDGSLKRQEFHGPANVAHWWSSYTVLQNILVMLDAVDLGNLLRYRTMVERYHDRFGDKVRNIIYQGDVRCRLENMPRLKRIAQAEFDKTASSGQPMPVGYDPNRPWNFVWGRACDDLDFWREEVNEPAFLIVTKIANSAEILDGDAKTAQGGQGPREIAPGPARLSNDGAGSSSDHRTRKASRTGRFNNVENGKYVTNRTGYKICPGFNDGTCAESVQGVWCPHAWNTAHQCDRCLGGHPSTKCPHAEMPEPGFLRRSKGKGKKGSGKKGKGSKRPPY